MKNKFRLQEDSFRQGALQLPYFLTYLSVKVIYKLIYCLAVVRNLQAFKPKKILQKKNGTNFRRYQVIE